MPNSRTVHVLAKVFFVLLVLALFVHITGFASPYWSSNSFRNEGLWRICYGDYCGQLTRDSPWFEATQTFEVIGLIAGFIALILIILFIFISQTAGNRTLFLIALATVYTACGSTVVGVIIYGSQSVNLSWSFGLTVIAGIAYGLAGGLMVMLIFKD